MICSGQLGRLKTVWIARPKSTWRPWLAVCPRKWHWGQYCLTSSSMTWMTRQSVPSLYGQLQQNWEDLLTHLLHVLLFRGTYTDWKTAQTGTSLSSTLERVLSADKERWPCTSAQHWWDTSGELCPMLGFPTRERYQLNGVSPVANVPVAMKMIRNWNLHHIRKGWESWA